MTVLDLKTGRQANIPPIASWLQGHAYGLAAALSSETPVTAYRLVLAFPDRSPPEVQSAEYPVETWGAMLERIKAIVAKPIRATMGPHCTSCWARFSCAAWTVQGADSATRDEALVPLTQTGVATPERVLKLYYAVKAMKDLADRGMDYVDAWVTQNGGLSDGNGNVLAHVEVAGRRSIQLEAAQKAGLLPALEEAGAVSVGRPSLSLRWRRAKAP